MKHQSGPTCVHCQELLRNRRTFTYPLSGAVAHFVCVSQPSVAEMDTLIQAAQAVSGRRKGASADAPRVWRF